MKRALAGWDRLDPRLARVLRIDSAILAVATLALAVVWIAGLHSPILLGAVVVLGVATLLMVASAPLTQRFGQGATAAVLTLIGLSFSFAGVWLAPNLSPLFTLLSVMPLLVLYPHVSRRWATSLAVVTVIGSAAVAGLGELLRPQRLHASPEMLAVQVVAALPVLVTVVALLARDTYEELRAQSTRLRESRADAVKLADAARRGIERDLHDGAQQRLVAMSLRLGHARNALRRGDLEELDRTLAELTEDNLAAVTEVRELARGIYPPLLTEKGLVAAVQSAARRSLIPVSVEADGVGRLPAAVENAAYFCILEALNNAVRHGHPSRITVRLRDRGGLAFSVVDDGVGFDPETVTSSGLLGMEARIQSAGGRLRVSSAQGRGTTVQARFDPASASGEGWTTEVNDR